MARVSQQLRGSGGAGASDEDAPADRAMITEADEALLWLRWLDKDIAQILWARANRKAWKGICWEHGISRATANRRHEYGLSVIVWRLNGRRPPACRSMRFVASKARGS